MPFGQSSLLSWHLRVWYATLRFSGTHSWVVPLGLGNELVVEKLFTHSSISFPASVQTAVDLLRQELSQRDAAIAT